MLRASHIPHTAPAWIISLYQHDMACFIPYVPAIMAVNKFEQEVRYTGDEKSAQMPSFVFLWIAAKMNLVSHGNNNNNHSNNKTQRESVPPSTLPRLTEMRRSPELRVRRAIHLQNKSASIIRMSTNKAKEYTIKN